MAQENVNIHNTENHSDNDSQQLGQSCMSDEEGSDVMDTLDKFVAR